MDTPRGSKKYIKKKNASIPFALLFPATCNVRGGIILVMYRRTKSLNIVGLRCSRTPILEPVLIYTLRSPANYTSATTEARIYSWVLKDGVNE